MMSPSSDKTESTVFDCLYSTEMSLQVLHKLQCIQNVAATIVSNTNRNISITPVLKKMHWFPVEHCLLFKTATPVYFSYTIFESILLRVKE